MSDEIDFVITWVDGNDSKWLNEKNKYLNVTGDSSSKRFRDFDILKYLFRSIEKYCPWVNKVHLITYGHLPKWININNSKLNIIKHKEYIPDKYLPTYNSNVLELNLHNINELSEKFVLFNDDIVITNKLEKEDFFVNNLPCDFLVEYIKQNASKRHIVLRNNNLEILNKYFIKEITDRVLKNKKETSLNLFDKKFIKDIICNEHDKYNMYSDFLNIHLTQSFCKSSFRKVWELENEKLDKSCYNRFRNDTDIGKNIVRNYTLLKGEFYPFKINGKYLTVADKYEDIKNVVFDDLFKIICLNDTESNIDFEKTKNKLDEIFIEKFKDKSSFEL